MSVIAWRGTGNGKTLQSGERNQPSYFTQAEVNTSRRKNAVVSKTKSRSKGSQSELITPGGRNTLISPSTIDMPACALVLNTKRNRNFDFSGGPSFR